MLSRKQIEASPIRAKQISVPICIIGIVGIKTVGTSHLVGEEIVVTNHPKYDYTATVFSQTAKLMVIDSHQFLTKFPQECKHQIMREYKMKQHNRSKLYIKTVTNRGSVKTYPSIHFSSGRKVPALAPCANSIIWLHRESRRSPQNARSSKYCPQNETSQSRAPNTRSSSKSVANRSTGL
jgi:hypothetical protein